MQTREPVDVYCHVRRPSTEALHREIVERAVLAIQRRFAEADLGLAEMADAALSSPFHFARLFRQIAGVPPGHFLTAVRMQEAKRLLEETPLSVMNVCLEVGYSSIGTFTRRFSELVGASPRYYRRLAQMPRFLPQPAGACHVVAPPSEDAGFALATTPRTSGPGTSVSGEVRCPGPGVPVVIGLFPEALPQGRPIACALIVAPGPYRIDAVPPGQYFVLAAGVSPEGGLSREPDVRGRAERPIRITTDASEVRIDIALRHRRLTDPPIVVCVPLLFADATGFKPGPIAVLESLRAKPPIAGRRSWSARARPGDAQDA